MVYIRVLLLVLVGLHAVIGQDLLNYDCRRTNCDNDLCKFSAPTQCLENDGAAGCTAGNFNYNCGSMADQEADFLTNCPDCSLTGSWNCADAAQCTCKAGYYWTLAQPDCSYPRIRAVCNPTMDGVDVYFAPYEGAAFQTNTGKVFMLTDALAMGGTRERDCVFTEETVEDAPATVYKLSGYPYTGAGTIGAATCPAAAATAVNGYGFDDTFVWYFYVQHDERYDSDADVEIKITCELNGAGTPEPAATVAVTSREPDITLTDAGASDIRAGVTFTLYSSSDAALATPISNVDVASLTNAVSANDEVVAVFELEQTATYDEFGVVSVEITNYPPNAVDSADTTQRSVLLMEDGCVPKSASLLVTGVAKEKPTGTSVRVTLTFKAFVFDVQATGYVTPTIPVGTLWASAVVCPAITGQGLCPRPVGGTAACDSGTYAVGTDIADNMIEDLATRRRRRQTGSDVSSDAIYRPSLNITFMVRDPRSRFNVVTPDGPSSADQDGCHESLTFILPLVLMAVLLMVAVVMAAYFCRKVTSQSDRNYVDSHTNMGYTK